MFSSKCVIHMHSFYLYHCRDLLFSFYYIKLGIFFIFSLKKSAFSRDEARISIKQQRTGNKKEGTYEVSIMIITSHHAPLIFSSVGFDLSEVLEELSQKLLKILSKRAKNRSKTSIRKIDSQMF